jgi:hemolysin activation/secretion protein
MCREYWRSLPTAAGAFGSDFDFSRHIVSARLRTTLSPHQDVGIRAIGGWSGGVLPPQRLFAIGGIGSVHGYEFKESVGDALALLNLEYGVGWGNDLRFLGFFDAGRVTSRASAGVDSGARPVLKGIGFGVAIGDAFRIDFGYKLGAVPGSPHVLVRFDRTF